MKTTIEELPLTPKQQRFCDEYLTDMNATRAALRAGYSQATAMNGQLMQVPKIAAYLERHARTAHQSMVIDHHYLLDELSNLAFANMGDYFDAEGNMRPMQDLSEEEKAAIWSITITERKDGTKTTKIRLNNKLAAMKEIAKHIQFYKTMHVPDTKYVYVDKNNLDAWDGFEDETMVVRKKQESRCKNQEDGVRDIGDDAMTERETELERREEELRLREAHLREREGQLLEMEQNFEVKEPEQPAMARVNVVQDNAEVKRWLQKRQREREMRV